ncbi:MAG: hypothetical protein QXK94_04845 [Candidatus Jordarchaeales archaeon]
MNEYEVVFASMVASGWRGVSVRDVARVLGVEGELGEWYAIRTLVGMAKILRPLGVVLKFNPVTGMWVATQSSKTAKAAGLPKRLKATLAAVLRVQSELGVASIEEVVKVRGKSRRSTLADLRELEEKGLVERVGKNEFRVSGVLAPFLEG